jgi:hypothetical protein
LGFQIPVQNYAALVSCKNHKTQYMLHKGTVHSWHPTCCTVNLMCLFSRNWGTHQLKAEKPWMSATGIWWLDIRFYLSPIYLVQQGQQLCPCQDKRLHPKQTGEGSIATHTDIFSGIQLSASTPLTFLLQTNPANDLVLLGKTVGSKSNERGPPRIHQGEDNMQFARCH